MEYGIRCLLVNCNLNVHSPSFLHLPWQRLFCCCSVCSQSTYSRLRLYLLKPNLTPPPLFLNNSNLQHAYFLLCIYIKRSKNYQPLYIELTFIVDQKNCKYVVSICKQNWKSEKNKTDRHFASDDAKMPNVPKNVCRWIWNKKM